MKFVKPLMVTCAILTTAVFGQDVLPIPATPEQMHQITVNPALARGAAVPAITGSTIPTWSYSVVSPIDGKTYAGQIIGVNPATKPGKTTVIPTVLVPVRLVFKYSSTVSYIFDPTVTDAGCLGAGNTGFRLTEDSPLFNDAPFVMGGTNVGTTQYIDAFQRANFWNDVSASGGANYHTLLGVAPMPLQTVTVTSANKGTPDGTVYAFSGLCGTNTSNVNAPGLLGVMNVSFWDPIARSMISSLGITPNTFVFFLFYNSVMSSGAPDVSANCCVLGYHDISGAQTYGTGDFDGRNQTLFSGTADSSALSHEFAEWMNDPTGVNPTPPWGHIGQVSGCQNNYEVGDPLSGTLMPAVKMPNGFTYHLQELAFFDWYYRISPSNGVKGWYSDNDTFKSDAGAVCD
ncbi:MAG: hypothetical protein WA261_02360 [Candidatus Sulfotelmatobacter sp.]